MFSHAIVSPPETQADWREFYLDRLMKLLLYPATSAVNPTLARAIYSTYLDCLDLGARIEADSMLARYLARPTTRPETALVSVRSSAS